MAVHDEFSPLEVRSDLNGVSTKRSHPLLYLFVQTHLANSVCSK